MKLRPYEKVAVIYDAMMKKLDYESWSNYILEIANEYIDDKATILELGAGSCKIAGYISAKYKNYYATDISLSMLKSSGNIDLQKICCDMTELPLKTKFDFIFSNFDGVNYILKQKNLFRLFNEVFHLLERDGVFTFDVSLESNSLNFVISKSVEGRCNGYSFRRVSQYNKLSRIHSNHFYIRDESGMEFKEVHKEKIYKIDTYFKLAEKAGFHTEACYDCFTFKDVNSKSERAQFILRKIS
jgi:predicted TPR repeat methyltransferase